MDTAAKLYWQFLKASGHDMVPPHTSTLNEGWTIWKGDQKIASPNFMALYHEIVDPKTLKFWSKAHKYTPQRLTEDGIKEIDWAIAELHMKNLKPKRRRWTTKNASENCGVNNTLHVWGYRTEETCPFDCDVPETTTHVMQCTR